MTILVDTGIFYALLDKADVNHLNSKAILTHSLEGRFGRVYTIDYVVLETTTLLRVRMKPETALAFTKFLDKSGIQVISIDLETYRKALDLFKKMYNKLSLTDAALITVLREWNLEYLATFDERSFSSLVKNTIGRGYFDSLPIEEKKRLKHL